MKKLQWWLRIVGGFYLLLGLSNMYVMFFTDGAGILAGSPFTVEASTIRVAIDFWSASAFSTLGGALFLLWASRRPIQYVQVAKYVAWLELTGLGSFALFGLMRGYDVALFSVFLVIHLLIAGTGFVFASQAQSELVSAQLGMAD